jgi:hypothetical protein
MRVEVNTVDEFLEELDLDAERVHEGIVRVRVDRVPEQDEEVSHEVWFRGTALVRGEDGDYVLEVTARAGHDRGTFDGTETADEWRNEVKQLCERHNLDLRKGKIEVY